MHIGPEENENPAGSEVGPLDKMYITMYILDMGNDNPEYSVADARANLSSLVNEAEAGAAPRITRNGKPVAVLLSLREYEKLRQGSRSFRTSYEQYLQSVKLERVGLEDDEWANLRDKGPGREVDW